MTQNASSTEANSQEIQEGLVAPTLWKNYLLQQIALGGTGLHLDNPFIAPVSHDSSKEEAEKHTQKTSDTQPSSRSNSSLLKQLEQKLQKDIPVKEDSVTDNSFTSKKKHDSQEVSQKSIATFTKVTKKWSTLEEYYTYLAGISLYKDRSIVRASSNQDSKSPLLAVVTMHPESTDIDTLFSGDAGSLWKKMLQAIDIDVEKTYTTSLIKNIDLARTASWREKNQYIPHLLHELEEIQPSRIILLGEELTQLLLKTGNSLEQLKQQVHSIPTFSHFESSLKSSSHSIYSINTYTLEHPTTLLQYPEKKRSTWEDLQWIQTQLPLS
jgi:uracil-DNA glycosylase family 4